MVRLPRPQEFVLSPHVLAAQEFPEDGIPRAWMEQGEMLVIRLSKKLTPNWEGRGEKRWAQP